MQVPLYRHNLHGHDIETLGEEFKKILSGMMLSTGSVSAEIAAMFADHMGTKHCLLTNNWTNAAQATLLTLGIGEGDEVVIPALTFVATANAIEAVGARPVLVDVDPNTKLMDIDKIPDVLSSRTKAIMPVHLYGQMVDVYALRRNIPEHIHIVEDAAHAIEAKLNGYGPGAHSAAAMFSFYNSKNMTTGEGGAMITNDSELLARFTTIYRHGIDLDGYKRHIKDGFHAPEAVTKGIKGNMPDLLAFLLRPQIANLSASHAARKKHAEIYMTELSDLGLEFPEQLDDATHAWHIFAIGVDADIRDEVIGKLDAAGIKTTIQFKPVHEMSYFRTKYRYAASDYPNSHAWGSKTISLPLFPDLKEHEQRYVIDNLRSIIRALPKR